MPSWKINCVPRARSSLLFFFFYLRCSRSRTQVRAWVRLRTRTRVRAWVRLRIRTRVRPLLLLIKIDRTRMAYSGFAFFYSKDWSLFLFLKGVARQGRALISDTYRLECLHSQMDVALISIWCSAPTPFIKLFFNYFVYSSGQSKILKSYFSAIAIFDFIRTNCHRAVRPNEIHFSSSFLKKITFFHLNLEIAKKSTIFAAQN